MASKKQEPSVSRRRAHILRAAEKLLEHYGFGKTTVADIARAAQVGVGTVYLEFPSKNAIVAELSVQRYRCVLQAMKKAAQGEGDAPSRLRAVFEARMARLAKYQKKGQHGGDLMQCSGCPGTEKARAQFRAAEEELLSEFLATAAGAGQLAVTEPRMVARVLLRFYDGYSSVPQTGPRGATIRREIDVAQTLLVRGLLPRGGE